MTPDEVRLLDNRYALLFIRGERPIIDLKYDILKHPNVKFTTDGNEKPYIHGNTNNSVASINIELNNEINKNITNEENIVPNENIVLLTEEELEQYLNNIEQN